MCVKEEEGWKGRDFGKSKNNISRENELRSYKDGGVEEKNITKKINFTIYRLENEIALEGNGGNSLDCGKHKRQIVSKQTNWAELRYLLPCLFFQSSGVHNLKLATKWWPRFGATCKIRCSAPLQVYIQVLLGDLERRGMSEMFLKGGGRFCRDGSS